MMAVSMGMIGLTHAADTVSEEIAPDGAMKAGPFYLYPTIKTGLGYTDNVTNAASNTTSSSILTVAPAVALKYRVAGDEYQVGYAGAYTRYMRSSSDDIDRHEFQAQANNVYSERARSQFKATATWDADARGSTDRAVSSEPDRYRTYGVNGLFVYGAKEATGGLEGELGYRNKRYLNNRTQTASSDVDFFDATGRFFYRVAPSTRSFVELGYTGINYTSASSIQDGSESRAMLGVTWDATAATSGTLKLGGMKKRFDNASIESRNSLIWEALVRWKPRSYSTFELKTGSKPAESTGQGDFVDNSYIGLNWEHKWSDRFTSQLGYDYTHSQYRGVSRTDNTGVLGADVTYLFRRWVSFSVDYSHDQRSSTLADQKYRKNVVMLNARFSL